MHYTQIFKGGIEMDNEFKHTFVTDYDCHEGLACVVKECDLLWDIKKLLAIQ